MPNQIAPHFDDLVAFIMGVFPLVIAEGAGAENGDCWHSLFSGMLA